MKAMRTMFVAPGLPSGIPAITTNPSRALTRPSSNAMRQALRTMWDVFSGSPVRIVCTPQTSDSRLAVDSIGVRPITGMSGRSRVTRRTVEPVAV